MTIGLFSLISSLCGSSWARPGPTAALSSGQTKRLGAALTAAADRAPGLLALLDPNQHIKQIAAVASTFCSASQDIVPMLPTRLPSDEEQGLDPVSSSMPTVF